MMRIRHRRSSPTGNAAMDTKYVLINHGRNRQCIKRVIHMMPQQTPLVISKSLFALGQKRTLSIILFPSIHGPRLVISTEHHHFVWMQHLNMDMQVFHHVWCLDVLWYLLCKQIGNALQRGQPPIHVIAQKQKLTGRDSHTESPEIFGKELEIAQIPMNVPNHIDGTLQRDGRFS